MDEETVVDEACKESKHAAIIRRIHQVESAADRLKDIVAEIKGINLLEGLKDSKREVLKEMKEKEPISLAEFLNSYAIDALSKIEEFLSDTIVQLRDLLF